MVFSNEAIGLHCCSCLVVLLIALCLRVWSCIYMMMSMLSATPSLGIGKKVIFDSYFIALIKL
jgi:hypothetical protein